MNLPAASWTNEGQSVSNGGGITVSTIIGDSASMSILTFNPLRTSHRGEYDCSGSLESPALTMSFMLSEREQLNTQSNL